MHYLKTAVAMLSLLPAIALAHTDAYLDTQRAPHGGQLRMAGPYHFELVVQADQLTLYVTDHAGAKIDTRGASGTATVLANKTKTVVRLAPTGDNTLRGAGRFAMTPDMKAVVSVTLAGQPAQQARFTPLAGRVGAAAAR